MDAVENALSCRLCGVNVVEGKCKNIFDESADLVRKIKETLPVIVSPDDDASKHICLPCHDRIVLHYKFIQEILAHAKESENTSHIRSLLDLSKEANDFSKLHNDAIYTCPNCNVELMFLLVNNPQTCDYAFQLSLVVMDHPDKEHHFKEKRSETHKSLMHLNNVKKNDLNIKGVSKVMASGDNTDKIQNQVDFDLPICEQPINVATINHEMNESSIIQVQKYTKRKGRETNSYDQPVSPSKTAKLEVALYEPAADLLSYDTVDTLMKVEPVNDNISWVDSENECKRDIFSQDEDNVSEDKNDTNLDDNDIIKSCPKIVCELCGARYLSQLKYEFHMERHKLNKMEKYECTLCDKEASSENLLWDHYYHTHKSLQRFACIECGKLFTKRCRLNGHQKSHKHSGIKEIHIDTGGTDLDINTEDIQKAIATEVQGKSSVNCNLCGKLISDLDPDAINDLVTCPTCEDSTLSLVIDGNEAKVISPRQYHCSMCPKHFVRKERLEFHEMRHNENMNEFICSTCGKEFSAENSLYEHYLFVHKGARPHICELCGKSFQLKARLKEHHRTHTGEKPYQCDICGQRCRTTYALKIHRKIHFSQNRYTCNVCNKSFSKKQNMNEHLEKHWKHDKNVSLPQLFTCPICLEDFPTYRMLKYHMIEVHKISNDDPILTKQKPWHECPQCHEKFKHQMSLKAHKEKVHEGRVNPVFQCDICNATFRVKQLLINHIKSKHDGEKRYKCAQCGKGFNDTKSLYNHVLLHTGKKPFVCEYCNMSFRRKDSRDHHRRKHTGEQPYQCPDCNESFSTYNYRSKHRKRVHGEGETECPECGEKCSGQQEIRIHLNKHLGEKLERLGNVDDV